MRCKTKVKSLLKSTNKTSAPDLLRQVVHISRRSTTTPVGDAVTALLNFEKQHEESDVKIVCSEVVTLLKQYDKRVSDVSGFCKRVHEFLKGSSLVSYFTRVLRLPGTRTVDRR